LHPYQSFGKNGTQHHLVAATQSWDAVSRFGDTPVMRFWARVAFTFLFCFLLDFRSELIAALHYKHKRSQFTGPSFLPSRKSGESLE